MLKKPIFIIVMLLIVFTLWIAQHLIRYWSPDADCESAAIVAAQQFMGQPLRQTLLAIPTVGSCTFKGGADLPFLTDEAVVRVHVAYAETNTVDLIFNLLGRAVYPASPRTKYVMDQLINHPAAGSVPAMAVLLQGAPDNDTTCSPEVLKAVPLK